MRRFALGALIVLIAVAAWTTATGRWDSAPGNALALQAPLECSPSPACYLPHAKAQYQQAVKADPSDKYGWYNLGVIAQSAKDSETAATDFDKAIAIDPKFESALYNLGVIRLQARDYTAAITLLTRAVAASPKDANAHWKLGIADADLHTVAGNERAKVEMNTALKIRPLVMVPPPLPPPCPAHPTVPSFDSTYCGPAPGPGNGLGPSGECTGRETAPPCGPGMIPDHYYAYSLPGRCDGRLILNGGHWRSGLPPQMPVPDLYGWVTINATGKGAGWMGPQGAMGLDPDTGQPPSVCTANTPPIPATTG